MVRYSKEKIAESRNSIRNSAAHLFRKYGYSGVGINQLCAAAGLTRGTFYSHFASKADLFTAVLRGSHDFVSRLQARSGGSTRALRRQAAKVASDYLAVENRQAVVGGCSIAALAADTTRAGNDAQAAYADAVRQITNEFRRAEIGDTPLAIDDARAALALCVGGLLISNACGDHQEGKRVAKAAQRQVVRLLTGEA